MPIHRWRLRARRQGALLLLVLLPASLRAMPINVAVKMGLAIHPTVRAAEMDELAAGTDVKIAKGGYYPSVGVSAGPRNSSLDGVTYELTATQMLWDWGRVSSQVAGASATQRQLSDEKLVQRDSAALDIVGVYLDVLDARQGLDADRNHIARLQEVLKMTEIRSKGGYADRSEPERTTLELARAQDQLVTDEGKLEDAENQFKTLVGTDAAGLQEPGPTSLAGYVARSDLDRLISEAPLYRKATEDTRYAESRLSEAKSSLLPQLNVEASSLQRDIGGRLERDSVIALRLRMNTFQGFSNFQQVQGAKQRVDAAHWKESSVRRDLQRQVQTLLDNAASLARQEGTLRDQADGATRLSTLYQQQFEVGRRDVIDLLNIQLERFQAERSLIDTHLQRIRLQYQAAAQLGLIGPLLEGGLA